MTKECNICLQTTYPPHPYCKRCTIVMCPDCTIKTFTNPQHRYECPQCRRMAHTLWDYSIALLDTPMQEVQHYSIASLAGYHYDHYSHVSMNWNIIFKHMSNTPDHIIEPIIPWEEVTKHPDYIELRNTRFSSYDLKNKAKLQHLLNTR